MSASTGVEPAATYAAVGYGILEPLIDPALAEHLGRYLVLLGETGRLVDDQQVPRSLSTYGDPAFDVVLATVAEQVAAVVGTELLPTYSFARLCTPGSILHRHRDRPACEHSVSLHLLAEGNDWPLMVEDLDGAIVGVHQRPGDAVVYQGTELPHWRHPLDQGWHAQVFLHYVAADGPHRDQRWDTRPGPGLPASTKGQAAGDGAR